MDMDDILISVVVPVYNTPLPLLGACIRSVLTQSHNKLELILVDDGSTQDVADFLDKAARLDSRVRAFHQANAGVSAARNLGLRRATGAYVTFVDADDAIAKGWLKTALTAAVANDADVVAGQVAVVDAVPSEQSPAEKPKVTALDESDLWRLQLGFLYTNTPMGKAYASYVAGWPCKLIKASCLRGLEYPVGISLSEDQVFNHFLLRRAKTYLLVEALSYFYVQNPASVSHSYHADAFRTMMDAMSMVKECIYDHEENQQAFYFKVLAEACTAFEFTAFSDQHRLGFREKVACLRRAGGDALLADSLERLDIGAIPSKPWRLKAFLVKHKLFALYVLVKDATDLTPLNQMGDLRSTCGPGR